MLNHIIAFSVRHKLIIGLMVFALIGVGIYQTTKLPIDAVPDITNNQVQVITVAPSFGATDIERLVTFPIEQANSNIAGMKEIRSFSRFGLSLVTIVFHDDIDVYWARQQVAERLQQVKSQIPKGIGNPELGPISTGLGEIYQYVVRPKKGYERQYDITRLRTIQDWIVRRQLLGVKGVAEVSSFGGKLKQYEIAIDPDRLNAYGITINDVFTALENNNQNTGGAYIERGPTVLYIRSEGLVGNTEDIENIAIDAGPDRTIPLFIRDVAKVGTSHATRYGAMTYNDQGEVSGAIVMMLKGANSNEVIRDVKARIAQIQKTLPEGVIIEPFLDRTKMVSNAIGTVEKNLMEGALIVVFVLVLFLGNLRAGLLVASVIPLSMLFAICMMNLFGVSGNLMSLGALDFGLIIDGAVIIVESVMHHLSHDHKIQTRMKLSRSKMDKTVVSSASKMMNSAVFGQIIILIVYLPILSLQGIEGKMFKPMAQTVAFALLGAFLLSLTYVPMMSTLVLSRKISHKPNLSDRVMSAIEQWYQRLLLRVIRIPKLIFGSVGLLFVLAIYILSTLGGEFIPSLEEGDFAVETRVLTGSSLQTTIEHTQKAAHILKQRFPEVTKVVTKIGSGEVPTDPMPMDASDMMVILKDKKEWVSAQTFPELADTMTRALKDVPGITVGFQFPVQMRFNELMTGARQDVVLKIFGENLDTLAHLANEVGKIVNTVAGTQALYVEPVTGMPQVIIQYNRAAIARYGLSIADINRVVNTAFAGQSSGLVFEGEKRFDMVVRLDQTKRKSLQDIRQLLVPSPMGAQIPLSQLADVRIQQGPNQIQRENAQRRIVVGFNIKGRDVQSIVEELQAKVSHSVQLPPAYYITYGGSFENLNQAKDRLMIAVPVALALIFVLLFLAFNSIKESLMIYTAIPLSIIGGVFLLALRGMPFSISAGVGFIALFGVAVLNGIVLIAAFNRLRTDGTHQNIIRIVSSGSRSRLRPVLMTAFVASLGFIPMALSNGAGAEVQRPLATVVIGGLMIATLLTLFVLPLLYITFEKGVFRFKKTTAVTTLLLLAFLTGTVMPAAAQQPLTLQEALQMAMSQNRTLKSEQLKTDYSRQLIKSAADLPQTSLSADYGQINSVYMDTRFGISQNIAFPTVYRRQKSLYTHEWQQSQQRSALSAYELGKAVSQTFYTILYWKQKADILNRADSLYRNFLQKAQLRLETGESNVLETATAENQAAAIHLQAQQVAAEITAASTTLQWLLNTDALYEPVPTSHILPLDTGRYALNPELSLKAAEQQTAKAQVQLESARRLPGLMLGYNNNSFVGTGADDRNYDAGSRFHSVQVGISLPLFTQAQKARTRAAQIGSMLADQEYQNTAAGIQHRYGQLMAYYLNQQKIVAYYENNGLATAQKILKTTQLQFSNGAISYIEFVTLVNQAIDLESRYCDALHQLNQTTIQLNYLTSN